MSLADVIAASTPASSSASGSAARKAPVKTGNSVTSTAAAATGNASTNSNDRPRVNSPAFQAYEDKKNACDARIADIRNRIVNS